MVMRKRKFNRRRFGRKRSSPSRALATKSYVKKIVHKESETKYADVNPYNGAAIDWSGTFVSLTTIAQGTTDSQRVGDKLTLRGIRVSWVAVPGDAYNIMRIVIFQWYPNTILTIPAIGNILQQSGSAFGVLSATHHDYANQFKVLKDFKFPLVAGASASNSVGTGVFRVPFKYVRKSIDFTAAGTTASNHIYALVISDSGAVTHPSITMTTRVWYDDS